MKLLYTLMAAAVFATAAMAQSRHPMGMDSMPRLRTSGIAITPSVAQPTAGNLRIVKKNAPQKAAEQVLSVNLADPVKLYTNAAYSQPGHYDYYFSFANTNDEFYFPYVFFDLYLPTDQGLEEGTYTMADGTVDPNLMLMANYDDYLAYYTGYAAYVWTAATISLTKAEGELWTVDFSATDDNAITYKFSYTTELPVEIDDYDPDADNGGGSGTGGGSENPDCTYKYEPTEVTTMNMDFDMEWYDGFIAQGYPIIAIYLNSREPDAEGLSYQGEFDFLSSTTNVPDGTYPVSDTEGEGTFLASWGCSTTSNSKDYPCYIRNYDENYVYDSWYIVGGDITIGTDAAGNRWLAGSVTTYNGSTLNFTAGNAPAAGIGTVIAPAKQADGKYIIDGRPAIRHHGKVYNLHGTK